MSDQTTILDQDVTAQPLNRRQLLPWWVKTFSWIFMVLGAIAVVGFVAAVSFGSEYPISLYGLQTTEPMSALGSMLIAMFILKAAAGFGLWFEKDWAITISVVDAVIGIGVCLFVMVAVPIMESTGFRSFRLELIFLVLYLVKVIRLKPQWN